VPASVPSRFDIAYAAALAAASPVLLARAKLRAKVRDAFRERDGRVGERPGDRRLVLVHGVSVGEINAARPLVAELNQRNLQVAVAATTETGYARATSLFGEDPAADAFATRFPIDTSAAVGRWLDRLRPGACVMMELEVWPNFALACERRGLPLVVANGRVTTSSFRQYRRARPVLAGTWRRVTRVLAQDATYAERFRQLGVPADRVEVAGAMKFDAAPASPKIEGVEAFASELGLRPRALGGDEAVIVAGSTGPGEEAMVLDAVRELDARLVIVPRHPPRFDEVVTLISGGHPLTRRSTGDVAEGGIVLVDTMGELRLAWALADVAIIGRTLVDLGPRQHGSDLIEPAALGKPVVTGPFYGNFDAPTRALLAAGAAVEVEGSAGLRAAVRRWLDNPEAARAAGHRGRETVDSHRGATRRAAEVVVRLVIPGDAEAEASDPG